MVSNIYLKVKTDVLKTSIFQAKKICQHVSFGELQPLAVAIEFENFLLQLKTQRSGSKTVCGFSFLFILKAIMKF